MSVHGRNFDSFTKDSNIYGKFYLHREWLVWILSLRTVYSLKHDSNEILKSFAQQIPNHSHCVIFTCCFSNLISNSAVTLRDFVQVHCLYKDPANCQRLYHLCIIQLFSINYVKCAMLCFLCLKKDLFLYVTNENIRCKTF